ncbi:MAG TPA: hypothetical protein VFX52_08755, partial [Nocardioidaceae bacterium]|nr:hypothetical protein [Nocardioidaceae bacterium]
MPSPSPRRLRARVSDKAARALRRTKEQARPATARVESAVKASAARRPAAPGPVPAPQPAAPALPLVDRLLRDGDLPAAVLGQVRTWVADGRPEAAVSLGESLRTHESTRDLGNLASGVAAFHRGFVELAWARLQGLDARVWAPHAPEEYLRCGLRHDRDQAVTEVRRLLAEDPDLVHLGDWITLAGVAFG